MDQKYQELYNRLNTYMSIEAISRFEEPVVEELKRNISGFEVSRDALGSVIFFKNQLKLMHQK
ncbi:hypothetical protein [Mycoplasma nasistruthionis]|uniref:hypothetical protein n=1 Tax=Mycoplasma nasistruthionis TaxID=353852 RepID=UPI0030B8294E